MYIYCMYIEVIHIAAAARMKRLIARGVRVVLLLLSLSGECIGML